MIEKHPLHLKHPELHTAPEVERAVKRRERRTGEKVPTNPARRIEAYASRLEYIFLNPDESTRERNLEMFRDQIYDALIIKRENFPDSYFELQQRVLRERGQAVEEISPDVREQMKAVAIEDQKHSLDAWIDYLTSSDAVYPAWFKYFVWKNVTKLSQFDKERGEFKKHTDKTVAPFPDIYREPLAQICDLYEQVKKDNKTLKDPDIQASFSKRFPTLYAELIQKSLAAQIENKEQVQGEWVKYTKGQESDAEKLFQSLEGKGTGWCTAGHSTAQAQIKSGDFYAYYTNDTSGNPTQPRLAIRMEGEKIGEVRGILPHQEVEPRMQEVLDKKLVEFGPEADKYRKKSADMKHLTAIYNQCFKVEKVKEGNNEVEYKTYLNPTLTKEDLIFLYEINVPIEGFGYIKDPRIQELRKQRDPKADAPVVLDCQPNQIAWSQREISQNTKAYLGPLFPGIFQDYPHFEHLYTSFPEGRIEQLTIEIGGKTKKQLETELIQNHIIIDNSAEFIMYNKDFTMNKERKPIDLVRLTVRDLGFENGTTIEQICQKAQELGLDLVPAEVGPHYCLQHLDQSVHQGTFICMKQFSDVDGCLPMFNVERGGNLWMIGLWLKPTYKKDPDSSWLFTRRPRTKSA